MSSKKDTKTSSTQMSTTQSSPTVPAWITNPTMTAAGQISDLQGQGYNAYAPGISDLQQQSFDQAKYLQGSSAYYDQARGALDQVGQVTNGGGYQTIGGGGGVADITNGGTIDPITGQSVLTNLDQYYNPFKSQVLNPVLADYDYQSGQTRAAQAAAAAKGGAFGGSRYGIQESQTEDALARGRASTEGGLLNQMYTQATGLSADDANRRQGALLANQQGQEFTAGQNLTASQANQQAALDAVRRQFQADQANQAAGLTVSGRQQEAEKANQAAALQRVGLLQGLGTAQDADARANVSLQNQIGSQQSDIQNAIKQYPLQYQAQIASLLQGLNPQLYTGNTTSGIGGSRGETSTSDNPGALGALGSAAQIASMFAPGGGGAQLFSSFRNTPNPAWSASGT